MPTYTGTAGSMAPLSVAYQQVTGGNVTISVTTEATAVALITAPSFTPNGTDSFWLEFWAPRIDTAATAGTSVILCLYDNGAIFGGANATVWQATAVAAVAQILPIYVKFPIIGPSAVPHVYSIRAYESGGNATFSNSGAVLPAWINISRFI